MLLLFFSACGSPSSDSIKNSSESTVTTPTLSPALISMNQRMTYLNELQDPSSWIFQENISGFGSTFSASDYCVSWSFRYSNSNVLSIYKFGIQTNKSVVVSPRQSTSIYFCGLTDITYSLFVEDDRGVITVLRTISRTPSPTPSSLPSSVSTSATVKAPTFTITLQWKIPGNSPGCGSIQELKQCSKTKVIQESEFKALQLRYGKCNWQQQTPSSYLIVCDFCRSYSESCSRTVWSKGMYINEISSVTSYSCSPPSSYMNSSCEWY